MSNRGATVVVYVEICHNHIPASITSAAIPPTNLYTRTLAQYKRKCHTPAKHGTKRSNRELLLACFCVKCNLCSSAQFMNANKLQCINKQCAQWTRNCNYPRHAPPTPGNYKAACQIVDRQIKIAHPKFMA